MKNIKIILLIFIFGFSSEIFASDALPLGEISQISYRGGYVTFKVIGPDGQNYCESCPTDPGQRSSRKCWIKEDKQFQLSMLLSAQARDKKVYGRVGSLETSCNVYQMSIED